MRQAKKQENVFYSQVENEFTDTIQEEARILDTLVENLI
jgi:hypothetical protein